MPEKPHKLQAEWKQFTQARHEEAYRQLYTHYYHYLSAVGLRRGFATTRVKDCINDVFLYLWENADRMRAVENHHSYIITTFLHKLARKEPFENEAAIELELLAKGLSEPSVETTYIQLQGQERQQQLLTNYLEKLPARQRTVLYQKFYVGLSYAEIAAANQLSVNTVYNTVYQALEKLKNQLGSEAPAWLSIALLALVYGTSH